MKIGRNDKCYCGSGKKYKKCCLNKDENLTAAQIASKAFKQYTYEEVDAMKTEEIIAKLNELGIPFDEKQFLEDVMNEYSADDLSEKWFERYNLSIEGRDEDFPWFAAWILWERLAPADHLSLEQIDELLEKGYDRLENNDAVAACDVWLEAWEALKKRNSPLVQSLDFLGDKYSGAFFVSNLCQDLEMYLEHAGKVNPVYHEKRIEYCREFCEMFPNENELILFNMKRAIGDSYVHLGKFEEGEAVYEKIIAEYPQNPFSYTGLGDLYYSKGDNDKALDTYKKGLTMAKDDPDVDVLDERIIMLKQDK